MNFNMLVIFYFILLIFVTNLISIKSDSALLFDVDQHSIVQKRWTLHGARTETACDNCVITCSASTLKEITYVYRNSIGKRALLVKEKYVASENINRIELPECDEPIRASVILNKNSGLIEIGYEIHDNDNILNSNSQLKNKKGQFLSLYPCSIYEDPQPKQVLSNYTKSVEKNFPFEENIQDFIWISILSIDFNIEIMSPTRIEYNPDSGSHRARNNCDQFFVGEEFYQTGTHHSAYSHENQRLIFTGKKSSKISLLKEKGKCGQTYGCLVQHQVIPSYYFHSLYAARAICTPMNTVPVWESIVQRIRLVDEYLYAMSQIWKSNITITNGFFGIFQPDKKHFKKPAAGRELFLDQANNNIPVPMFFYKLVEYKISAVPMENIYHHYAVIVIHNDPTLDAGKQRICKEKNTLRGWEEIQNPDPRSGLTYVCPYNDDVKSKLKLPEKVHAGAKYRLELNDFLTFDPDNKLASYKDKKSEIRDKINEFF